MMNRMRRTSSALALLSLLLSTCAYALSGTRSATAVEKQFIAQMNVNYRKAMPHLPAAWDFSEVVTPPLDTGLDANSENQGLRLDYTWHISSKDRGQKEALLMKKLGEHQGPKDAASLQARMGEVSAKMGAAIDKGDNAGAAKYADELEKLGKQTVALHDGADLSLEAQRKIVAGTRARVVFTINHQYKSLPGGSRLFGDKTATFAFRTERSPNEKNIQHEGETTLLYGPWKKNATGDAFEATYDTAKKYPTVQTAIVVIHADPKIAEILAKTLNAAEIQSWLK